MQTPRTPAQRVGTALMILAIVLLVAVPTVPVQLRVGAASLLVLMLLGYGARKGRGE